jgi:uncharacterized protein (DUF433 family)
MEDTNRVKIERHDAERRDRPSYTVAEAARYLSIPGPTLRAWFVGLDYPGQYFKPVIQKAVADDRRLSFTNLVEAHVLRALRTKHGISMPNVRKAIEYVQTQLGIERLLIDPQLKAGAGRMFLDRYSHLIDLPTSGQLVIRSAFAHHLEAVVRNPVGVPVKLYPWMPNPLEEPRRTIVIDPEISFGAPVTAHRSISTAVLTNLVDAGVTLDDLAAEYGLSTAEVGDAIQFERAAA